VVFRVKGVLRPRVEQVMPKRQKSPKQRAKKKVKKRWNADTKTLEDESEGEKVTIDEKEFRGEINAVTSTTTEDSGIPTLAVDAKSVDMAATPSAPLAVAGAFARLIIVEPSSSTSTSLPSVLHPNTCSEQTVPLEQPNVDKEPQVDHLLYCPECYLPLHPDPKPERLYIFLHALRYSTSLGTFETDMPEWAEEGWEWDAEW
jgi:hypothetical protein